MCGVTGIYSFSQAGKQMFSKLPTATEKLKNRGPDGSGIFSESNVALGHCRLSIIDTSTVANQPMYDDEGKYVIIYNGEIFNFIELKERYFRDEIFKSHSDTEVILKLYSKFKEQTFQLLRGFFTLAIYERLSGQLILARDRFGKKPLLYFETADYLAFASEMKSLLEFSIPKEINWSILPVYFQLNYIPQPYSIIQGVKKVKPGTYLKITQYNIEEHQYYTLKKSTANYLRWSYTEAQEILVNKLDEAVRLRLIADVPLGAFLSGGIDSSVVTALASRHTQKLQTFSIGYKDHPYFDETKYANLVAKKYKTDHTVFSLNNKHFIEHVYNVLNYLDEPFADSSAIPQFILSNYTKQKVTVALSGDGGDEVFAGYNKYSAEWRIRNRNWKSNVVGTLAPLWEVLPKSRSNKFSNLVRQLNRYSKGLQLTSKERYWQWASLQNKDDALKLFNESTTDLIDKTISDNIQDEFTTTIGDDFNDVLLADIKLVLVSDMLVKVDLMSMANSLEIRSPFLDQEVVEFAFNLPASYKINSTYKKRIVQDAFRSFLPNELYNRPKRGFEIPLRDWLINELWELVNYNLLSTQFIKEQNIFNVNTIEQLKSKLRSSDPEDSHAIVWALVVFQYWWKRYFS